MRPIASLITVVALGWHAIFGCCAHHAHAGPLDPCCESRHGDDHASHVGDGDSDQLVASPNSCEMSAAENSHHSCRDIACSLLANGKSSAWTGILAGKMPLSVLDGTIAIEPIASAIARWRERLPGLRVVPALPLYLTNQALLT